MFFILERWRPSFLATAEVLIPERRFFRTSDSSLRSLGCVIRRTSSHMANDTPDGWTRGGPVEGGVNCTFSGLSGQVPRKRCQGGCQLTMGIGTVSGDIRCALGHGFPDRRWGSNTGGADAEDGNGRITECQLQPPPIRSSSSYERDWNGLVRTAARSLPERS